MPLAANGSVVAIGNFDGVHKGHQEVLRVASDKAKALGLPLIVVTFEPHPRVVLQPQTAPLQLTGFAEKCRLLAGCGADGIYVLRFTRLYARTSPEDFVKNTLINVLHAKHVVVGHDFAFGRDRSAGLATLKDMGNSNNYGVTVVEAVRGDGVYSSTSIRAALAGKDIAKATNIFGRCITVQAVPKVGVMAKSLKVFGNGDYPIKITHNGIGCAGNLGLKNGKVTAITTDNTTLQCYLNNPTRTTITFESLNTDER